MKEIEAKFSDIDPVALRLKLAACGFSCAQPEKLMRRKIFSLSDDRPSLYGRVRDEGHQITMTIKEIIDGTINGVHEAELVIQDFDQGVLFMEMAGWAVKAYQETRREIWHHREKNSEVVIDTWPGIPVFCEIEGQDEQAVQEMARQLGFDWSRAFFGAVDVLYWHHLNIPHEVINDRTPVITFDHPPQRAA